MKYFLPAVLAGAVVMSGTAQATTYSATDLGLIVDRSEDSTSFSVTDLGSITSIEVTLGFSACNGTFSGPLGACVASGILASTFNRELGLSITSAAGTEIDLVATGAYSGQDETNPTEVSALVTFDDDASNAVGGPALVDGTFSPSESLSAFLGELAAGTWTIGISDSVGGDPKRLNSYSVTINTDVSAVPLPAGAVLLLTGLGALGLRRRKKAA